jgi:hypothetical protein
VGDDLLVGTATGLDRYSLADPDHPSKTHTWPIPTRTLSVTDDGRTAWVNDGTDLIRVSLQ